MSESQIVVCELGDGIYGLDISSVFEIIRVQEVTAVPRAPDFVEGVVNLRGRIVPVVDLARRFGMQPKKPTKATRIVVVGSQGSRVGLMVDGVSEVLILPDGAVEPAPEATAGVDSSCFQGIAKVADQLVIMLDLVALLDQSASQSWAAGA